MVFEYKTVKYKFCFVLTVIYSKAGDYKYNFFLDDNWAKWMTIGCYIVRMRMRRKRGERRGRGEMIEQKWTRRRMKRKRRGGWVYAHTHIYI